MNADVAYTILEQISEFLDQFVDVVDGRDGQPAPNKAMQLKQGCDEMLVWLEQM